jgi:3-keto-5-aminohexanoate cleavage enzyme
MGQSEHATSAAPYRDGGAGGKTRHENFARAQRPGGMRAHAVYDKPLIIEARLNEFAPRSDGNPNVPYSTKEIIEDGCRAWEAGASILHWHCRDPETGEPCNDVEPYLEVLEGLHARTDALLHPTLGYISQSGVEERVKHVRAADENPQTRVDLVPVDFGTFNIDLWDPRRHDWESLDAVYHNPRSYLKAILQTFRTMNKDVLAICWDTGHARTARKFQEMGLLPRNTLWELFMGGERLPGNAGVSLFALQAMVAEVDPGAEWLVAVYHGDVFPLAAWAVPLGGHVAVGIGDYPYTRFGAPSNAELVERVAKLAETVGRPVATAQDVRRMLA